MVSKARLASLYKGWEREAGGRRCSCRVPRLGSVAPLPLSRKQLRPITDWARRTTGQAFSAKHDYISHNAKET